MKKDKIAIIIATYNAERFIENCIGSILKQTNEYFEIIVVDNKSFDKTRKLVNNIIESNSNSKIHLLENNKNLGFAKACNIGIKYALSNQDTNYVLLLNQDTVTQDNLLDRLLFWAKKMGVGAYSTKILFKESNRIWWIGTRIFKLSDLFKSLKLAVSYHVSKEQEDNYFISEPEELESICGCALFLHRKLVEDVGYLDEKFFMYGEDLDYSLRVKAKGYKLYIVPGTVVYHDVNLESEALSKDNNLKKTMSRYYIHFKSSLVLLFKHFPFVYIFVWVLKIPFLIIYEMSKRIK